MEELDSANNYNIFIDVSLRFTKEHFREFTKRKYQQYIIRINPDSNRINFRISLSQFICVRKPFSIGIPLILALYILSTENSYSTFDLVYMIEQFLFPKNDSYYSTVVKKVPFKNDVSVISKAKKLLDIVNELKNHAVRLIQDNILPIISPRINQYQYNWLKNDLGFTTIKACFSNIRRLQFILNMETKKIKKLEYKLVEQCFDTRNTNDIRILLWDAGKENSYEDVHRVTDSDVQIIKSDHEQEVKLPEIGFSEPKDIENEITNFYKKARIHY